ncbi:MAG TPA: helix-turn-helix transcriptional regulator [Pirellulaceae bacterium]|jgi:transcriptional regulator with XRE-family HTH domain|nr:helix-turn-helix transcriptional regulator [Pirellulaceae bacterium]
MRIAGERLAEFRERRQLTQASVAGVVGIHRVHLSRIENGAVQECSLKTICALAEALRVPITAILELDAEDVYAINREEVYHSSNLRMIAGFHDLLDTARSAVTVSKRVDSYLQSDAMVRVMNPESFVSAEAAHPFLKYVEDQRETYSSMRFLHVQISPTHLLPVMARHSPEWLIGLCDSLADTRRPTIFAFVNGYWRLRHAINQILPPMLRAWSKLLFVDDVALKFHLDGPSLHAVSYDRPLIGRLRRICLDHVEAKVVHEFPSSDRPGIAAQRSSRRDVLRLVRRLSGKDPDFVAPDDPEFSLYQEYWSPQKPR